MLRINGWWYTHIYIRYMMLMWNILSHIYRRMTVMLWMHCFRFANFFKQFSLVKRILHVFGSIKFWFFNFNSNTVAVDTINYKVFWLFRFNWTRQNVRLFSIFTGHNLYTYTLESRLQLFQYQTISTHNTDE